MNKLYFLFYFIFCIAIFSYGFIVGKYEVFPYQIMKMVKNTIKPMKKYSNPKVSTSNAHKLFQHFSFKADVAFIGDSITDDGRWSEFFPNIKVVNRGVAGDKTSDIIGRLNSVISTQPTKAFIMIGINDIMQYVSVSNILENYSLIVDALLDAGIAVTIQSTIQCEISKCGKKNVKSVNELNNGLVKLALKKRVNFLSLGALSGKGGLNRRFSTDGVHLNAEGYIYWVDKLTPFINI